MHRAGRREQTGSPDTAIVLVVLSEEDELRERLHAPAPNRDQALYIGGPLKTARVMVKDEDVCLHCGLCAERCPTGAWDMQKMLLHTTQAGPRCRDATADAPNQPKVTA